MSPNLQLDLEAAWGKYRRGPLDAEERQAAIAICENSLATYPQRDMAAADAIGLLGLLGLYRPQKEQ